ncbi:hypothetical protein BS78_08G014900 [Paspalum vaginatum]|nr:hypothetical protein BS78_08G014900 [Paspalum vaginatum]
MPKLPFRWSTHEQLSTLHSTASCLLSRSRSPQETTATQAALALAPAASGGWLGPGTGSMARASRSALLLFLPLLLHILLSPSAAEETAAAAAKPSIHDGSLSPVQEASPIATVPSTNPTPTIITVPSTNPTITIPSLNPLPTPVTAPATTNPTSPTTTPPAPVIYPLPTPSTSSPPSVPVTNPTVTAPSTFPPSTPSTNPLPSNPTPPPASSSGQQVWCVVKAPGSSEAALQNALDYACGIGGADCSAIQPSGSCYYPNTLQAHASYAFNAYYQRNPVPSSCDFGGTAMLITANPSQGSCVFASSSPQSSSSTAGYSPASASNPLSSPSGSDSGSPFLSSSGSGPSEPSEFGPDIPGAVNVGKGWRSISLSHWAALAWILAFCAHIEGMVHVGSTPEFQAQDAI